MWLGILISNLTVGDFILVNPEVSGCDTNKCNWIWTISDLVLLSASDHVMRIARVSFDISFMATVKNIITHVLGEHEHVSAQDGKLSSKI